MHQDETQRDRHCGRRRIRALLTGYYDPMYDYQLRAKQAASPCAATRARCARKQNARHGGNLGFVARPQAGQVVSSPAAASVSLATKVSTSSIEWKAPSNPMALCLSSGELPDHLRTSVVS